MATTISSAHNGRNVPKHRVSYKQKFQHEMDCKNRAYAFILQNGHYDEFRKFCRSLSRGDDPHEEAIQGLFNGLIGKIL